MKQILARPRLVEALKNLNLIKFVWWLTNRMSSNSEKWLPYVPKILGEDKKLLQKFTMDGEEIKVNLYHFWRKYSKSAEYYYVVNIWENKFIFPKYSLIILGFIIFSNKDLVSNNMLSYIKVIAVTICFSSLLFLPSYVNITSSTSCISSTFFISFSLLTRLSTSLLFGNKPEWLLLFKTNV